MNLCLFCPNQLDYNTAPEHILLDCLGGKKTTKRVICTVCNLEFGNSIDNVLCEQVKEIRNLVGLESGTGKPPPMLRNFRVAGRAYNLRSDSSPQSLGKPFDITTNSDGTFNINAQFKDEEQFIRAIPHMAAKLRCTVEHLKSQFETANLKLVSQPLGEGLLSLTLGGPDALRSVMKSCLVLWSTKFGKHEVQSKPYAAARTFVKDGDNTFRKKNIRIDNRPMPLLSELEGRYGPLFNLIYIKSDQNGRVVGCFNLYNIVTWRLIIADSEGVANQSVGLVSNPLYTKEWSDTVADQVTFDFDWLNAEIADDEQSGTLAQRMTQIVEQHHKRKAPAALDIIINDVSKTHGVKPDEEITFEKQQDILRDIADRMFHFLNGKAHERALTQEEIRKIFEEIPDDKPSS